LSFRKDLVMKIRKTAGVLLCVMSTAVLWAQNDVGQSVPDAQRNAPPPAYGQESAPVVVNENPPISGLDQPSLEPNIQPRSMLLGGVQGSESLDSNIGSDARPAIHSVTRGLGGLTVQRLWSRYQLAGAYVGGVGFYNSAGVGLQQLHELQGQQTILWRTGQLSLRDSFSYLPEGSFGFASYGGAGGYQLGLGGLGSSMGLVGSPFGSQGGVLGSAQYGSLGQAPRFTNVAVVDAVESLSPRSSVTASGSFGLVHFQGAPEGFINSQQLGAELGYSYQISHKDQVAISYGFQDFHFPSTVGAENFTAHVVQGMYGHRISGRMDFVLGAGPQWTRFSIPGGGGADSRLSVAGRASLRYRFRVASVSASFERFDNNGSGLFAGAISNVAHLSATRSFGRKVTGSADLGFAHNQQLQSNQLGIASTSYNYGFAGFALRREFGYNWGAFLSYQWSDQIFDTCPVVGTFCNRISVRHVLTLGVDWHFRPIRID
jgi:hypothetical protein